MFEFQICPRVVETMSYPCQPAARSFWHRELVLILVQVGELAIGVRVHLQPPSDLVVLLFIVTGHFASSRPRSTKPCETKVAKPPLGERLVVASKDKQNIGGSQTFVNPCEPMNIRDRTSRLNREINASTQSLVR